MKKTADEIARSVDLASLLTSYGVELKQRGNEYKAKCIWHDDTRPSMSVFCGDEGKWVCYCHSCGEGGDAIDVVQQMDGCDKATAIERIKANHFVRDDTRIQAQKPIKPTLWQHEMPPEPLSNFDLPKLTYQSHWTYLDGDEKLLGYVVRYIEEDGEKTYRPWTYGRHASHLNPSWKSQAWTAGRRPIYGLDLLAKRPTDKVLIVEDEKTADAARALMPGMVCITWPGGANGIAHVDWTPLKGRNILLVPDADFAGEKAMINVAAYLLAIGCTVRQLDTSDKAKGWDLADAVADGWTNQDLVDWAKERISPLTSREIEERHAKEKKTVQKIPRQDDMPPSATLIEGVSFEIPTADEAQPANVVPIKKHTGVKESSTEINDPTQTFTHLNLANIWIESDPDWLYCHTRRKWLQWDGSRWKLDLTESAVWTMQNQMKSAASWMEALSLSVKDRRALGSIPMANSVLASARTNPKVRRNEPDFDKNHWILGTPGGTVDLRTGELREADRSDLISKQTSVTPEKGEHPYWDMVINRCTNGDPEMKRYYQKWCGYSLTGDASVEGFLVVRGPQGSGKSKLLNTMREIMGEYAISFQIQVLLEQKYGVAGHDIAMFSGARLAVTTEPTSGHRWNEGFVKALTGRDRQQACRKYENPFEFDPIAKIWISANEPPQLTNADGMERRLHLCEFPPSIPDDEKIENLPDLLRKEYPAILAWCIEGCLMWQAEGLQRPGTVKDNVAAYVENHDVIADWIGECLIPCDDRIKQTDLYKSYSDYAKGLGQGALGNVRLAPELVKRGYKQGKSNGIRYWYGFRLKTAVDIDPGYMGDF